MFAERVAANDGFWCQHIQVRCVASCATLGKQIPPGLRVLQITQDNLRGGAFHARRVLILGEKGICLYIGKLSHSLVGRM